MSLIDYTYFFSPLEIAQITSPAVQIELQKFIDYYEPEFLSELMGAVLYNEFSSGLELTVTSQIYSDLRDGANYTYRGVVSRWNGLIRPGKRSMIANYIYFMYMQDKRTTTTPGGEKVSKAENARDTQSVRKLIAVWNDMVKEARLLTEFLSANYLVYPSYNVVVTGLIAKPRYVSRILSPINPIL